jgi:hypothetical protein
MQNTTERKDAYSRINAQTVSGWMRLSMRGSWLSAGRFLKRGFGTGHERAMPMTPSPTSNSGAMCDLNGVLDCSRTGGKSADAERLVCCLPHP